MPSQRERVVWATVFSLPPAAGIALATAKMGPGTLAAPLVGGAFVAVAVVMFALVYGAVGAGDGANTGDEGAIVEEDAGDG